MTIRYGVASLCMLALIACKTQDRFHDLKSQVVHTYSRVAHANYSDCVISAETLHLSLMALVANPSAETLEKARTAWIAAREPYGESEVFRFYGGPIDNPENGPEMLINAWPLDEAHIDYVDGNPAAGIINDSTAYPEITEAVLIQANENPGETDIATGYHAIEFLLWGQDLESPSSKSPGKRSFLDYSTNPGAKRRAVYLEQASLLLLKHLRQMRDSWAPDQENYRRAFESMPVDSALYNILRGFLSISGFELAGERLTVSVETGDQEDEHSCFSDNTNNDIMGNIRGLQNLLYGRYKRLDGTMIEGKGLFDLGKEIDSSLAIRIENELALCHTTASDIMAPFDYAISEENQLGILQVHAAVDALRTLTTSVKDIASKAGYRINVDG